MQGGLLALKEFQDLYLNLIVTIATNNTRRRWSKSGPLCALRWRILTWCSRKQGQARHIHASTMSRPGIHCVVTQCLVIQNMDTFTNHYHFPALFDVSFINGNILRTSLFIYTCVNNRNFCTQVLHILYQ